ncbi:MAG: hypothetical protein U0232_16750 [Thermomicrobiales bacterium]
MGLPLVGGGLVLTGAAFRDLGPSLTALPKPKDDSQLVREGR